MPEDVSLMDMYYQGDGGIYDDDFTDTIQRKKRKKNQKVRETAAETLAAPPGLGAVSPTPAAAQEATATSIGLGSEYMTPVQGQPLQQQQQQRPLIPQTTSDVLNLGTPVSDTGWKGFNEQVHSDPRMRESQLNPPADELSAVDTQIPGSTEQIKMFISDIAERETANPTAKGRAAFAKITAQYPEFTGSTWAELQEHLS